MPVHDDTVTIGFLGSGGAGALTAGTLLLEAACLAGCSGLMTRSVGPQIRGGEALALVRVGSRAVQCHTGEVDLLLAIDWENAARFGPEIALAGRALVVCASEGGEPPPSLTVAPERRIPIALASLCKAHPHWRENILMLGAAGALLGLPPQSLQRALERRLGSKGAETLAASRAALAAGAAAVEAHAGHFRLPAPAARARRWLISGNEALGLGTLRGGARFAAAYPITPATDLLEWLAPALDSLGGRLVQAEDELASVNMIIGAAFGGTPALTATSGPGLALMLEAIGLATAAEIPITVIDVMRGGPSTGIPTKSEQADLNIALHGLHGDAPHLVLAPQGVADCVSTGQWAIELAEALQCPAIVLSDQFLGQALAAIEPVESGPEGAGRLRATGASSPYRRYALGESGVSPMSVPGEAGGQYTAEGLTHTERGLPTSAAAEHVAQLDKRRDKLDRHAYGDAWATLEGEGEADVGVLTWGSLTGVAREALAALREEGLGVRLIAPRLLAPARPAEMGRALAGISRLLVLEQSHGAQFYRYLRAWYELPPAVQVLHRSGPLRIRPVEVCAALRALAQRRAA